MDDRHEKNWDQGPTWGQEDAEFDDAFDFQQPSPVISPRASSRGQFSPRSPRSPQSLYGASERPHTPENRTSQHLTSSSLGWSPRHFTNESPIGILEDDREHSPITASPGSRNSVDVAVHRPIAQRLEQVAHPVLLPDAMSAQVQDYEEYAMQGSESPYEHSNFDVSPSPGLSHLGSVSPYASGENEAVVLDGHDDHPDGAHDLTGFNYVEPSDHIHISQELNDPNAVYYPAPVPSQLKLPPILSQRNRNRESLPVRKARPRSMLQLGLPLEPEWDPSPIDQGAPDRDDMTDIESMLVESDASSYAATNLSDDSYQGDFDGDDVDEYRMAQRAARRAKRQPAKKQGWLSTAMHAIIGKQGDLDAKDKELVDEQQDVLDEFDSTAFARYDEDHVREEAKRFEVGGIYSSTRPSGGKPTSLIEELEIRKKGRALQRKNIIKDADNANSALMNQSRFLHPLDKQHQPTLMELQQMAEIDYSDRKKWHQEATVRQKQDRGEESLAQRKARLRSQKQGVSESPVQPARATESLAERRARRRAEKEYRESLIVRNQMSPSVQSTDSPGLGPSMNSPALTDSPVQV